MEFQKVFDMEVDEDYGANRIKELFEHYQALHASSYPLSPIDFNKLDLTLRVKQSHYTIGKGRNSDVYIGRLDDQTLVGVKLLRLPVYDPLHEGLYKSVLLRFFRELNYWHGLDHLNIARLLGFTRSNGNLGFVSLWYPQGNLSQHVQKCQEVSCPDLMLDVAEGIQHLHTRLESLIHGDLKGANILINAYGIACLADFGISRQISDLNRQTGFSTTGGTVGTTPWMAPELLGSAAITRACDIYSFGGVLLEIICPGKFPYHYLSQEVHIIVAKCQGELPSRTHYPELDDKEELWSLITSCFANAPEERYDITAITQQLYTMYSLSPRVDSSVARRPKATRAVDALRGSILSLASSSPVGGVFTAPSGYTMAQLIKTDFEQIPDEYKTNGSDWYAIFNPQVKRVLGIGLAMSLDHESIVCCVRFSYDGKYLATGSNHNVNIYDTKIGTKTCILTEGGSQNGDLYIRSLCFSPDGNLLAAGAEDKRIRVWNIAERKIKQVFHGHTQEIYSLQFSPDGRKVVSGSGDKTIRVWDVETGEHTLLTVLEPEVVDAGVTWLAISPNGRYAAAGSFDAIVRIWDVATGRLVERLTGHQDSVYSIAFTPDGKGLVSGSLDRTSRYWSLEPLIRRSLGSLPLDQQAGSGEGETYGGHIAGLFGYMDSVLSASASPDCAYIVSGSKEGCVQFWNPRSSETLLMLRGHSNSIISMDLSSSAAKHGSGLLATGSTDGHARIWSYGVQ